MTADDLAQQHLGLAYHYARKYRHPRVEQDEMNDVALFALAVACTTYDPARGAFFHYASSVITRDLIKVIRSADAGMRTGMVVDDSHLVSHSIRASQFRAVLHRECVEAFRRAIRSEAGEALLAEVLAGEEVTDRTMRVKEQSRRMGIWCGLRDRARSDLGISAPTHRPSRRIQRPRRALKSSLTAEQRRDRGRKAAAARWGKA